MAELLDRGLLPGLVVPQHDDAHLGVVRQLLDDGRHVEVGPAADHHVVDLNST